MRNKWEARLATLKRCSFFPYALTVSTDESCRTIRADVSKGRLALYHVFALDRASRVRGSARSTHSRARSSGIVPGEYLVALLIVTAPRVAPRRPLRGDARDRETFTVP